MLTPSLRGLKEKYPGCHLTVATSWDYQAGCLPALLRNNPFVDQVVRVEPHEFATGWLKRSKWEFKGVVNDHIPDCVQHCDLVIELAVVCADTETREMHEGGVRTHRTDIWCKAAGVNPSCKKPVLVLTPFELEEGRRWCEEHLGDGIRVGVPLKAMSPARTWPYAGEFCYDLVRAGYKPVSIDQTMRVSPGIPALLGKPIRFVASVIAHLDAVVTPDTGILHVAGALGVPVLGLFGSSDGDLRMREYAGRYSVAKRLIPCGGCWYKYQCLKDPNPAAHFACMKRISRKLVLHELECMLEEYQGVPLPSQSAPTAFGVPAYAG